MKLGDEVRDKISGFTGIATARLEYLNGCVRWQVTTQILHDSKPIDGQYFDEEQLEVVKDAAHVGIGFTKKERELAMGGSGGDRANPPRRS